MKRAIGIVAAACAALLVWGGGHASAAVGDLTFAGCLANDSAQGCTDVPNSPLGSGDLVVSSDGKSVYTSGSTAGVGMVSRFDRAADGSLTYAGCLGDTAAQGCADVPGAPLEGISGLGLSPDGKSLYAASVFSQSLTRFARAPDGALTFAQCLASDASDGCTDVAGANTPMDNVSTIGVSPDGSRLYMQGDASTARLLRFNLDPQGVPSYASCLGGNATDGCTATSVPFLGRSGIEVTSSSLYAFAGSVGAVTRFNHPAFTFADCVIDAVSASCTTAPNEVGLITGGTITPDGRTLFSTGTTDGGSIGILTRYPLGADGAVSYGGCVSDATAGCVDLPNSPIAGANGVAVSPDGASLYVAGGASDAVSTFRLGTGGTPTFATCLGNNVTQGCATVPGGPLDGANSIAVSPDRRNVYVSSSNSKSVAVFSREVQAPADPFAFDLTAKGKQRAGKLSVKVTCSSACDVSIRAKGKAGKKFKSKKADAELPAGTTRLKVKLKRNVLRKVDDRGGKVTFVATATSGGGATVKDTAKAKLKP